MATVELQESVHARLAAQANAEGLTLEAYLEKIADSRVSASKSSSKLSSEELDRLLDAEASDDVTYQGTYPRADIYLDHD